MSRQVLMHQHVLMAVVVRLVNVRWRHGGKPADQDGEREADRSAREHQAIVCDGFAGATTCSAQLPIRVAGSYAETSP